MLTCYWGYGINSNCPTDADNAEKAVLTAEQKKLKKLEKGVDKGNGRCYYNKARCGRGTKPEAASGTVFEN